MREMREGKREACAAMSWSRQEAKEMCQTREREFETNGNFFMSVHSPPHPHRNTHKRKLLASTARNPSQNNNGETRTSSKLHHPIRKHGGTLPLPFLYSLFFGRLLLCGPRSVRHVREITNKKKEERFVEAAEVSCISTQLMRCKTHGRWTVERTEREKGKRSQN